MKLNLLKSVRSISFNFAVACGMALTSAALHAESAPLRVTIPFGFTVAGHSMPAGEYTLSPIAGFGSAMTMHSATTGASVIALVNPSSPTTASELTFTTVGAEKVLSGINAPTWAVTLPMASGASEAKVARATVPGMAAAIRTH